MSTNLAELLSSVTVEAPMQYQKLRLFPVKLNLKSDLHYLTLDDATREKLVAIEETSTAGSVPKLRVRNLAKDLLLIVDGSTLIGAKQNRVVNLSLMLAPESVTEIPVSCVEHGRWSMATPAFAQGDFTDKGLREKMCRGSTDSLREKHEVSPDQGVVWGHVEEMLGACKAASPTRAYHAIHEKMARDLADCDTHVPFPPHACGAAVEIDGALQGVDLFDKPNTLCQLWPRLVRGYFLSALNRKLSPGAKMDVREFLQHALASKQESYEPVGVGTTVRLTNAEAVGAALICEGKLVHLSLFAKETRGSEPPRSEPPRSEPPRTEQPVNQILQARQNVPRRSWWRFWA
jgi:hypothetical protein